MDREVTFYPSEVHLEVSVTISEGGMGNADGYMVYDSLIPSIRFIGLYIMTTSCLCLLGIMMHAVSKEASWSYSKCSLVRQRIFKNKKKNCLWNGSVVVDNAQASQTKQ